MREFIYGRNPVYETLRTHRREVFRLQIAGGVKEKGRLKEIMDLAGLRKVPLEQVDRAHLDKLSESHQGVALEVSAYPYINLEDILENAAKRHEPLFVLILDALQNPQNLGTLIRTAEAVGIPLAVVVGSEGEGLRPLVRQSCDFLLRLPMQGQVESLNAAVAGSVALYLAYLSRHK
jgi:23S rRNA (guanosine2251-2'-O)-methyltransferase